MAGGVWMSSIEKIESTKVAQCLGRFESPTNN